MKHHPNRARTTFRHAAGFSLMELLVVMVIILILAGLTIGGMKYVNAKQNLEKCKVDIGLLSNALEAYKSDIGEYPIEQGTGAQTLFNALYWDTDLDGSPIAQDPTQKIHLPELDPNNTKAKWTQAQGNSFQVVDPWLSGYNYRRGTLANGSPNSNAKNPDFDIWSGGPDGRSTPQGNANEDRDNITNWK